MKRYHCQDGHNFSIDYRPKKAPSWASYLSGPSIRNLASERGEKRSTVADHIKQELLSLPKNELITQEYCTHFGGVLCVDGVYVKVKGLPKAIPFIYGIDYVTHDIPAGILDFAENEAAFYRLFQMLKDAGYPLRLIVADEAPALKPALQKVFPGTGVQLCHVHVLRNIRKMLYISEHDKTHLPFFFEIQKLLTVSGEENRRNIFNRLIRGEHLFDGEWEILRSIHSRWDDLFRYESIRKQGVACPRTTNLIEAFNNHFKSRSRSIKGFESFSSAERYLNAWMIKRRFTPFRECGEQFKHLNGHTSFEKSRNPDLPYPDIIVL